MGLEQPRDLKDLADVKKLYQQLKDNVGFSDMNITDLRTAQPTTDQIDIGKFAFAEVSGVPKIYYRSTGGTIFQVTMVAV